MTPVMDSFLFIKGETMVEDATLSHFETYRNDPFIESKTHTKKCSTRGVTMYLRATR